MSRLKIAAVPRTLARTLIGWTLYGLCCVGAPAHAQDDSPNDISEPIEKKVLAHRFAPIGIPQPLRLGVELPSLVPHTRIITDLGLVYIPLPSKRTVRVYTLEGGLSFRPWDGGFFINLLLGYRYFAFSGDFSAFKIDDVPVAKSVKMALHTVYLAPVIGYAFKITDRLRLGFDIGAQLPFVGWGHMIAYGVTSGQDSNNTDTLFIDDGASMRRIARLPIPQLTLFRLTWEL